MIRRRCAIYTRKSTEEGLDQSFNSLDAQREASAAYILSQRHEGWSELSDRYDEGGFSGGSMDRPGLRRLITDIRAGRIDVVVVYKVDRLTRSLSDFAKMVEIFFRGRGLLRLGHPGFQHHDLDGAIDAQRAALLCAVRAGGHGGADPRQGGCLEAEGHVDGGAVPMGYDATDKALAVNEVEADAVRRSSGSTWR
jgi:hypothetical protein